MRAAITALVAQDRRVTLAGIEQVSRELPEGTTTAKTVLRNPECRALYDAAVGRTTKHKGPSAKRALRVELAAATNAANPSNNAAMEPAAPPSVAELRRAQRLDRRSKRELAAMVIRLEREVAALHRHNANLRDRLLRDSLGHDGRGGTGLTMVSSSGRPTSRP